MKTVSYFVIPIFLIVFFTACGTSADKVERTYPQVGNYPKVDLQELINISSRQTRDTVNVEVVVIEIFRCDDTAVCDREDGITVAERAGEEPTLQIPAVDPYQFERDLRYLMSIEAYYDPPTNSRELRILGYSLLQ